MAPSTSRQVLVWSLPTVAFLLSLLWYRRKRAASLQSDPGGTTQDTASTSSKEEKCVPENSTSTLDKDQVSKIVNFVKSENFTESENHIQCENSIVISSDPRMKKQYNLPSVTGSSIVLDSSSNSEEYIKHKTLPAVTNSVEDPLDLKVESAVIIKTHKQEKKTSAKVVEKESEVIEIDESSVELDQSSILDSSVTTSCEESTIQLDTTAEESIETGLPSEVSTLSSSSFEFKRAPFNLNSTEQSSVLDLSESGTVQLDTTAEESTETCPSSEASVLSSSSFEFKRTPNKFNSTEQSSVLDLSESSTVQLDTTAEESTETCPPSEASVLSSSSFEFQRTPYKLNSTKILETFERDTSVEKSSLSCLVSVVEKCEEETKNKQFRPSSGDSDNHIPEDLEPSSSVENSKSGLSVNSKEEEIHSCSGDSSSDSVEVMARKSSIEASTMEKHSHEEDNAKKLAAEAVLQRDETMSLEHKLANLELDESTTGETSSGIESSSASRPSTESYPPPGEHHGAERDSANHSPADVMLASPSMSSYSDNQSEEGSSDSGKGCSDVATPPSRTPASGSSLSGDVPVPSVYEFLLPQQLVGRLIGRHGCFVHQIKAKTNASILIKRHPETNKQKICAVEGTQADVEAALEMIRQKFPQKRYPQITLEQVCFLPAVPTFPLIPDFLQLYLVEGVNNDVILSSLVNTGHFFLQQPTHPTFPALNRLNSCMSICYNDTSAPPLPMPTHAGVICAAPCMGGWYRAQIVAADENSETSDVKFVDYGGYMTIENSVLRQIRSDYMTLPFQAAECYLASVGPAGGAEEWSKESYDCIEELTQGQVLQAQIYAYAEDGLPLVLLYSIIDSQVVLVNSELVSRGHAEWLEVQQDA